LRLLDEIANYAHGLDQRFFVIQDGLVIQTDEYTFFVMQGRVDFNGLHFVGVLEGGVRNPALHIGGPGDECVLVPEANGFAVPAWDIGTQPWYRAIRVEFAADMNIDNEVQ